MSTDSSLSSFHLAQSYKNYCRFAPTISSALDSFPTPLALDWQSSGLRYSTFSARLRDAVKALREHPEWECRADRARNALFSLSVLSSSNTLYLGPREAIESLSLPPPSDFSASVPSSLTNPAPLAPLSPEALKPATSLDLRTTEQVVAAFALLASFFKMPRLELPKSSEWGKAELVTWTEGYDVGIVEQDSGFILF